MKLRIRQPAPIGSRFAVDAFELSMGQAVELRGPGHIAAGGRLVAAEVVDDGAAAILELDFPALRNLELSE